MTMTSVRERGAMIPKRRWRHYSYDESLNEPATLIKDEPVEIEGEVPAEKSRPVERIEENKSDSPAFEE